MRTRFFIALVALSLLCISAFGQDNLNSTDSEKGWKFAVICDTRGSNTDTQNKSCINDTFIPVLAKDIVSQGCDLILVPGDMINGYYRNGTTPFAAQFHNWRVAMAPVYDAGIEVYPVRGNHENGGETPRLPWPPVYPAPALPDTQPGIIEAFKSAFNDSYMPSNGPTGEEMLTFSFKHKNAFFIGLDEYINPHKVNQAWLDEQLSENDKKHIFVFGHEPAYKVAHNDSLAYYPNERDLFWNCIGAAGGKIYFCGHDHLYDRAHISDSSGNEVYQVIIGSCGAPLLPSAPPYAEGERVHGDYRDNKHLGYMLVTMRGNRVDVDWRVLNNTSWETWDSFNYTISPS